VALALAAVVFATLFIARGRIWPRNDPAPQRIMLAVLPFENLSGDSQQEYFSSGLTEEMITQLGDLEPNRLGVIACTSAMQKVRENECRIPSPASTAFQSETAGTPMTEERKHAILLATVILTARKLQPLLEEDFAASKLNMSRDFWAEVYTKRSIERAAHILDLIDEKWPASVDARRY
jgi:hypothetical protein